MSADNFPQFNQAVAELTEDVEALIGRVNALQSVTNVQTSIDMAAASEASASAAAASEAIASAAATSAAESESASKASELAAAESKQLAKASEDAAKASELASAESEAAAEVSQLAAAISEAAAKGSEDASKVSEIAAKASETAAKASETASEASEIAAKASEVASKASEVAAAAYAAGALDSENAAKASELEAKASELASKASEIAAKLSEEAAYSSESFASEYAGSAHIAAGAALASKTDAAASALAAAASEAAAKASETAANQHRVEAANSATESETSAASSAAASAASAASAAASQASEVAAMQYQELAGASAQAAAASELAAAASAASAASSEGKALGSEASALASELAAQESAAESLASEQAAASSESAAALSAASSAASSVSSASSAAAAAESRAAAEASAASSQASSAVSEGVAEAAIAASVAAASSEGAATAAAAAALQSKQDAETSQTAAAASALESAASAEAAQLSESAAAADAASAASSATAAGQHKDAAQVARDEAIQAAAALSGAMSDLGGVDLSSGAYPAVPLSSAFWKVTTGGTVDGVEYGVGDTLVYSLSLDVFYKIDNTESVTSVQGKKGAVSLTPDDVGALAADATAAAAHKLSTPRNINGVPFDGTQAITIADPTKEPAIPSGAQGTYLAGDKTWADLGAGVRGAVLSGFSAVTGVAVSATDTVLSALAKLQGQVSSKADSSDPRLSDSREWSAPTVSQVEAEGGESTSRRAWTVQRVWQAAAAWWASSPDKTKLDGIAAGAQVNVGTNLAYTTAASNGVVTSSTGTNATLPAATTALAGLMTGADKTKLDGIAAGAQVNTVTSVAGKTGAVTLVAADIPTLNQNTTGSAGALVRKDTRSLNQTPGEYEDDGVTYHFKFNSTTGFTAGGGTYHRLLNLDAWNGTSGGLSSQMAFGDNGTVGIRTATSDAAWGAWHTFYTTANKPSAADVGLGNVNNTADSAKSVFSATQLQTARTINGVSFNGTANITIADATKLPLSGGTMTGAITLPTIGTSWIQGTSGVSSVRFSAASTASAWHAWMAQRTAGGNSFAVGQLGEGWYLTWASNDNIANNINQATLLMVATSTAVTFGVAVHGNGSGLTTLNASNLTSGTIPDACLSGTYTGVNITGNAGTANRAGALNWTNYGGGQGVGNGSHLIFDASSGVSPSGSAVNNTNPTVAWVATYPTLMGWNGTNTHGVRVDRARHAESLTSNITINGVAANVGSNITIADSTKMPLSGGTMTGAITLPSSGGSISGSSGGLVHTLGGRTTTIGSLNTSFSHYNSSTGNHYFYGNITAQSNITAYSDIRVKANLEQIPDALRKVQQLTGYTFDRTDIETPRQMGVVAQEVQAVAPEAIHTDPETGHLHVAYGNLVGLLIEAIKELKAEVDELKKGQQ